jgi:DNA-directed RNA polymerase subunit RPC12/RpoP
MLGVRDLYARELAECKATFEGVEWRSKSLSEAAIVCPECNSHLVEQRNPSNTDRQSAEAFCRACGADIKAERLVEAALEAYFETESYIAAKDGGEKPLYNCPECSLRYLGRGGGLCLVRFERTSRYRATLGRFTASQVMFFHPEHLQEGRITFFQKIQIARGFSIRGNNVINLAFSRGG